MLDVDQACWSRRIQAWWRRRIQAGWSRNSKGLLHKFHTLRVLRTQQLVEPLSDNSSRNSIVHMSHLGMVLDLVLVLPWVLPRVLLLSLAMTLVLTRMLTLVLALALTLVVLTLP